MLKRMINYLFLIVGILCVLYYFAMGFSVRFGQSMLWVWPVAGIVFIARFIIVKMVMDRGVAPNYPSWLITMIRAIFILCLVVFLGVEAIIATGLFKKPAANADYVLLLGAKVESRAFDNRIHAAAEYLQKYPDAKVIATGGQGTDEEITEAQYAKNKLLALGIDGDRIILEEKATSTSENFSYSLQYIIPPESSVVVVTNDFHMFRSLRIAKKCGYANVTGLPVASSWLSFPHYMLREFFTTVVDTLKGNA